MGDQVLAPELPDELTMHVFERAVVLPSGVTVWLRRFHLGPFGRRVTLADGRWCAQRGGRPHLYAEPQGAVRGGARWQYRSPYSFATWQAALEAAIEAEQADDDARARKGQ